MNEINYKALGTRIRKQRELLGYTREELAEKLDVSVKFCSDIELGVKGMSLGTLVNLSKILCLNIDYILLGDNKLSNSELNTIEALISQCPAEVRPNLITMIRAFVDAVKND